MIMQAREKRLAPLHWGRREKAVVGALIALATAAVVALAVYGITSGGASSRKDCVEVTFASTLGGAKLQGCGARARQICASGAFASIGPELSAACRRAGFMYKPPS